MRTTARVLVCCFGLIQLAAAAGAAIKTTPGELVIDTVEVAYRRAGDVEWRQGLPLLRLQGERISTRRIRAGDSGALPNRT